jgi:hypothetical protein
MVAKLIMVLEIEFEIALGVSEVELVSKECVTLNPSFLIRFIVFPCFTDKCDPNVIIFKSKNLSFFNLYNKGERIL